MNQEPLYQCQCGYITTIRPKIQFCPNCGGSADFQPLIENSPEIDFVELMLKRTPKCTTSNTSLAQ